MRPTSRRGGFYSAYISPLPHPDALLLPTKCSRINCIVARRTHVSPTSDLDTLFAEADYPRRSSPLPFRSAFDRFGRLTWKQPQFPSINNERAQISFPSLSAARARRGFHQSGDTTDGAFAALWSAIVCYRPRTGKIKRQTTEKSAGESVSYLFYRMQRKLLDK